MNTPINGTHFDKALIRECLERARNDIKKLSGGRKVNLLAVTKTVPIEVINYTIDELGITAIGENRVQELLSKYELLHHPGNQKLEIHFIGSLQTNKVKYIIDKVDMIESVDSLKLACEIDRQAKKRGITVDILIEVNIGREEQKGGILPEELDSFDDSLRDYTNIRLRGLMTIAPKLQDENEYIKYFSETRKLFDRLRKKYSSSAGTEHFDTLSMGMSGSYRAAISAGATEVRLGSTIFGARTYPETKM